MSNKQIKLNVLAKNLENAKAISDRLEGNVYVGVMVKNYPSVEAAVEEVNAYKAAGVPVSVGLGAGDPAQWKKVAEVSSLSKPGHINQVYPAAGYTIGVMEGTGEKPLVNALIGPSGTPGMVTILTGEKSQAITEYISADAAMALFKDVGVQSVKFYPIEGDKRLDELAAVVKAATKAGIMMIEPTGGIDGTSVYPVVKTCLENGAEIVVPHIYTAFVNKETGMTDPEQVAETTKKLMEMI